MKHHLSCQKHEFWFSESDVQEWDPWKAASLIRDELRGISVPRGSRIAISVIVEIDEPKEKT